MADSRDWYTAGHKPPAPRKPSPGNHQWTLVKGTDRADCEFRLTIDVGCEVQLFKNRELVIGQLFRTRAQAKAWAETKRAKLLGGGWQAI